MAELVRVNVRRVAAALSVACMAVGLPGAALAAASPSATSPPAQSASGATAPQAEASSTSTSPASTSAATTPSTSTTTTSSSGSTTQPSGTATEPSSAAPQPVKKSSNEPTSKTKSSAGDGSQAPTTTTTTTTTETTTTQTTTSPAATKPKATKKTKRVKKTKPPALLKGWLVKHTVFPQREVVLVVPAADKLTASGVHLTEDGVAVGSVRVTALTTVVGPGSSAYLASYRSRARRGQTVTVAVSAKGASGTLQLRYATPKPAPPAHHAAAAPRRPAPEFIDATPLARAPGFASAVVAPSAAATGSFWMSGAGIATASALFGLLLAAAVLLTLRQPATRTVRKRVESFLPPVEVVEAEAPLVTMPRKTRLTELLSRNAWWPAFVENVQVGRLRLTPLGLVKRAAAAAMVLAVLATLVSGSILVGLIPLLGWPFVLRILVNRRAEKQRTKFRDSLPNYLQDLASAIRVGRSLVSALTVIAESAEEPTRSELEHALTDESLGLPLEESLEAVSRRMNSTDMDQVALIAGLNRKSGSNIAEALDRVAEGARERADLRREMRALTAQAKMSSFVLTALPGVLLVGLSLISPQYAHPLFHTTIGLAALIVGAVMVAIGWKVMQKITNVEA